MAQHPDKERVIPAPWRLGDLKHAGPGGAPVPATVPALMSGSSGMMAVITVLRDHRAYGSEHPPEGEGHPSALEAREGARIEESAARRGSPGELWRLASCPPRHYVARWIGTSAEYTPIMESGPTIDSNARYFPCAPLHTSWATTKAEKLVRHATGYFTVDAEAHAVCTRNG